MSEFIGSFILVFSFLIIRYSQFDKQTNRYMSLIGPLMIGFAYKAATEFAQNVSKGIFNPTIAMEVLFWSLGAYND